MLEGVIKTVPFQVKRLWRPWLSAGSQKRDAASTATEQLIMECLSSALQRENACAVLRRLPEALANVGPPPAP